MFQLLFLTLNIYKELFLNSARIEQVSVLHVRHCDRICILFGGWLIKLVLYTYWLLQADFSLKIPVFL